MEINPDDIVSDLLPEFYKTYKLGDDGGFSDNKVKIEISKDLYFFIPNSDIRREAVLRHDIHHLLTSYKSDFMGETEISSWELSAGCGKYYFAWFINSHGQSIGFWINLKNVFKAWRRGKSSSTLYHDQIKIEKILEMKVWELQKILGLDKIQDSKIRYTEYLEFVFFTSGTAIISIVSMSLLPAVVLYNCYIFMSGKHRINTA